MSYWIAPSLANKTNKSISVTNVIYYICNVYEVTYEEVKSRTRLSKVVRARQMIAYVLHKIIGMTLSQIGELLSRDHSTIIYSWREVEKFLDFDIELREVLEDVINNNHILITNQKAKELCK